MAAMELKQNLRMQGVMTTLQVMGLRQWDQRGLDVVLERNLTKPCNGLTIRSFKARRIGQDFKVAVDGQDTGALFVPDFVEEVVLKMNNPRADIDWSEHGFKRRTDFEMLRDEGNRWQMIPFEEVKTRQVSVFLAFNSGTISRPVFHDLLQLIPQDRSDMGNVSKRTAILESWGEYARKQIKARQRIVENRNRHIDPDTKLLEERYAMRRLARIHYQANPSEGGPAMAVIVLRAVGMDLLDSRSREATMQQILYKVRDASIFLHHLRGRDLAFQLRERADEVVLVVRGKILEPGANSPFDDVDKGKTVCDIACRFLNSELSTGVVAGFILYPSSEANGPKDLIVKARGTIDAGLKQLRQQGAKLPKEAEGKVFSYTDF
ncbi:MAG: hypothetical protein ABH823_01840 [bacterium]